MANLVSYRTFARVLAALTLLSAVACAASPRQRPIELGPVDTGPGTLAAARAYLEGRWRLLSYEILTPGEPALTLTGNGMLTYDGFGNLEMEIRVDEPTAIILRRHGVPTMNGVLSSRGRTAVDMQARTLTYILEGQPPLGAPSGPLALNRTRHWEVEGNVLTVTTRSDAGQPASVGRWEKIP